MSPDLCYAASSSRDARLTALKGIGPWTAHYIAMRALAEPDAFPHTDLGLRKAAAAIALWESL